MLRLRWTIVAIFLLPVLILLLWLFRNEITTQIIGAVFLLGMFVQWLIGRRRTGFIGVSPEHLAIAQRRGRRVTLYSWPELHCAHMSKDSLIVTVCGPQIILFQVKPKGRLKECLRILRSHLFAAEAEPT